MSDVLAFIKHRPPMVLIDTLCEHGVDYACASLRVHDGLMFCEADGLPTWVSLEIMAQTVSLYAGVQGAQVGRAPKLGFLLGTRKLILPYSHFTIGALLHIRATQVLIDEQLGVFDCTIDTDGCESISARLSVYEPRDGQFGV